MDEQSQDDNEHLATARAAWSRPSLRRLAASDAELFSAIHPDGLGDQLS